MGIHGIYKEIGPGRRVALSKLAVEKFEETGRPLRIAIDTSIWLFQIQASKGGTNPALRTFYYRLLRLIALSIHPVFVFDGPNKPPFKRNKRTGPNVASIPEFLAKQLLKQFGYPIHLAPGEAEAECALLQREGIVDAVLSEDVDTLMFGSGITIRNWSPEKSGKTPTHVNVYDAVETKNGPSALDREGMILVALMSGGDYVPEGIPGCGPKTACEAAKAGFGRDLCSIPRNDPVALSRWRERLQHELKTNESKLFKRKHGALKIPRDFPRLDILGYYTHPVISTQTGLDKLRRSINWDQELDYPGLRGFTGDAFDWVKLEGAKHFVRSLAPSLLVRALRMRAAHIDRLPTNNIQAIREDEALLVKGIHGKRQHAVTDSSTELRVSFTPIELVKINLDDEEPDDDFELPPSSQQGAGDDDDLPLDLEDDAEGPKKRGPTRFDPTKPARIWVMETFVKVGVPLKVEDWEAERQTKAKPRRAASQEPSKAAPKAKTTTRRTKTTQEVSQLRIQSFAKVTKPGSKSSRTLAKPQDNDVGLPPTRPKATLIDLLSSSPVRQLSRPPIVAPPREKTLSPVLEDLPASDMKQRRRAPIQRSKTLPSDLSSAFERPDTPPLLDTIETLDLVNSSPAQPSPSQLRTKKAKTRITKASHGACVTASPGKGRQTTLDTWRASQTPTKLRDTTTIFDDAPVPTPSQLRCSSDIIDTLDLTLSPPLKVPQYALTTRARPPLTSISSNASRSSSSRSSVTSEKQKATTTTTRTRRTSPRLNKTKAATPGVDTLDLTTAPPQTEDPIAFELEHMVPQPQAVEAATVEVDSLDLTTPHLNPTNSSSPDIDSLDLTGLASPIPPPQQSPNPTTSPSLRRSPRNHTSLSREPQRKPSPPAAWKAKETKKRQIILRKSLAGAWAYVDAESPAKGAGVVLKGKERRRWRESEVEILDLS
ncbi:hypothetical protein BU25DRAFT_409691 [Macroventuria anomochaeta]|uniref:Uncharacterized protein n=1 Tax=Macroventuria anomochaeta TaxID=301207 RepID=A0ACB6S3C3_9PLEO|nr:uncharacterized protein BU25DRAFT_409691 [Macroventuria anomochaeta]KAF2628666.1 hypothetical protein BU25DRAFT_409691 [Macroventuria anomochaeta]